MSELERIQRYIGQTAIKNRSRYNIGLSEAMAIRLLAGSGKTMDAISLAFDFGRAKGYRAAKKEARV